MRWKAICCICFLITVAQAQQKNPLAPGGFEPPKPPKYSIGAPDPNLPDDRIVHWKSFGNLTKEGSNIHAVGGVEFQFRGYNVKAKEISGDVDLEQFMLSGDVIVRGSDQVTTGDQVWVDFKEKKYRFENGRSDLMPKLFDGRLLSDLYARGASSEGTNREQTLFDGEVTTCPLGHPHFEMEAAEFDVKPGDRIIFRNFRLRALGKTLVALPHLTVPLNRPEYNGYLPDVGRSELEGTYVKSKFTAGILRGDAAILRTDFMEKLGLGLGLDQKWGGKGSQGDLQFYNLYDNQRGQNSFTGDLFHNQTFGNLSVRFRSDFHQNIYLTFPDSRSMVTNTSALYRAGRGSTQLNFIDSRNESGTYSNTNQSFGLSDSRPLGNGFSLNNRMTYSNSTTAQGSQTLSEREQVDLGLGLSYASKRYDGDLSYQRLVPIGETTNFISGSNRTPVLTLRSDSRRLLGLQSLPRINLETSVGQYLDNFTDQEVNRYGFGARSSESSKSKRGLSFGYSSEFYQSMYSDDTAQYVLQESVESRYGFSDKKTSQSLLLRYDYLRPYGFTPLSLDRRGQTNLVTLLMESPVGEKLTLRVGGGYDLLREKRGDIAWNTVGAAMKWEPAPYFKTVASTVYDPVAKAWSTSRFRIDWKAGATKVGMEARYDALQHIWGNLNLRVDGFTWGRTKVSAMALYNGYLRKFESRQLNLTYDLHCVEAVLSYSETAFGFRNGKEFNFAIRIKALPYRSDFGIGPSGQPLDTSTGVDF
jgi:hypothetical protein